MFSPQFMRFIITHDIDNYPSVQEKTPEAPEKLDFSDNKIFKLSRFVTIPIEVRK